MEKQIEDAKKMVQQVCQPKFKIPDGSFWILKSDKSELNSENVSNFKFVSFFVVARYIDVIAEAMATKNPPTDKNFKVKIEIMSLWKFD